MRTGQRIIIVIACFLLLAFIASLSRLAAAEPPGPTPGPFPLPPTPPPGSPYDGYVASPHTRSPWDPTQPVTLTGYTQIGNQTITFEAVDQNTRQLVPLPGSTTSAEADTPGRGHLWTFNAGVLPPNFWAPQTVPNGANLKTSQGHLEIVAKGRHDFYTFSEDAYQAMMASGEAPVLDFSLFADGGNASTVLFAQNGAGNALQTPHWTPVSVEAGGGGTLKSPLGTQVGWGVGSYTVESGMKIYGLICTPTTALPNGNPVVIYNHGGIAGLGTTGDLTGVVTSAGWTPINDDGAADILAQCLDWAANGWVFATSTYRAGSVSIAIDSARHPLPPNPPVWTSDGYSELCLGEVTDVLALTDLVVNHADSIQLGSGNQQVTLNVDPKSVFMYGWSHGGCITYRAVEQGAPIKAFAVIEGFIDFRLGYLNALSAGLTDWQAAKNSHAFTGPPTNCTVNSCYYFPYTSDVMGYNWRSPYYFVWSGDLRPLLRIKTMPILILHGDSDTGNPVFLDEAEEMARGLTDTAIASFGPVANPHGGDCIEGDAGAPIPAGVTGPNASCTFITGIIYPDIPANNPDHKACTDPENEFLVRCAPVPLLPNTPQGPPHYMVLFHNMGHVNGGLMIKETFNGFVENIFHTKPGCDGLLNDKCTSMP